MCNLEVDVIPIRCELCGMEHEEEHIKKVSINGNVKDICEGCVTEIKGFA